MHLLKCWCIVYLSVHIRLNTVLKIMILHKGKMFVRTLIPYIDNAGGVGMGTVNQALRYGSGPCGNYCWRNFFSSLQIQLLLSIYGFEMFLPLCMLGNFS